MLALRIKKAVRNGATLVVADPRKIWLTKLAKRHLQLRPGTGRLADQRDDARDPRGGAPGRGVHPRAHRRTSTRVARGRLALHARGGREGHRRARPRRSARRRASTRRERHAAIFYTLGITEHACGVDNIWSLSNLVLMTGHLGYESTGLNALRGQNNVQGLNDSGANPSYLPATSRSTTRRSRQKFAEAWGVEVPETPGYRLDQMISGPPRRPRSRRSTSIGENPAQTEPNAHHVEEGLEQLEFMVSQDIFLNDSTREVRATSSSRRRASPRRTARSRTPSGGVNRVRKAVPTARARRASDRRHRLSIWRARSARLARVPESPKRRLERARRPAPELVRHPLPTGIEEHGLQWPCTDLDHPGTPFLHAPRPARQAARAKFFPVEYQPPIEQPDSELPVRRSPPGRTLYHYNSATMTMREDGIVRQAGGAVLRDLAPRTRSRSGSHDGDWRAARLAPRRRSRRERRIGDRVYPGLVWMALHFAAGEGELAHARRRRPADRDAG